ncbi:MAG: hypothetical protein LAT82_05165 [Nanoarchaeota archaeon]|nr:hypothetical protein [Nanoarchaeota archaeon]
MIGNSVEQFKEQVKKGFASCKEDITELQKQNSLQRDLLQSLIKQITSKDEYIEQLNSKIEILENSQKQIFEKLKELENNTINNSNQSNSNNINYIEEELYSSQNSYSTLNKNLNTKTQSKPIPSPSKSIKDPYEALLEFKAKVNKKDIIKQKILSTIPNEGINSSELCFLFVEHFKYCSKATFYNYLKELEFSNQIRTEREKSKNMIYTQGTMKIPEKKLHSFT